MKKPVKIVLALVVAAALLVILFIVFFRAGKTRSSSPGEDNYNIILMVSDTLRSDVLGCYGGRAQTPNLDWLARNGVVFENAYSTAPCTLPSSVSMLTGNYSRAYGVLLKVDHTQHPIEYIFFVNDDETLLSEALKKKGYDVVMEVENPLAARSNNLQGFRKFRKKGLMDFDEINYVEDSLGLTDIDTEKYPMASRKYYWRMYDLLYYLLTVPAKQNFFLLKWFLDPHAPYDPAVKFKEKITIDTRKLPRKERFYSDILVNTLREFNAQKKFSGYEFSYFKELYQAEVESVDERVGYILKALEHRDLFKNTFIVFTSDHGTLFGEHGAIAHGEYFYQQLVHVPLIMAGPGLPKGKRIKTMVSHLDLMPTLKELSGAAYKDNMKGKSFKVLFTGNPLPIRPAYFDRISNEIRKDPGSDALVMKGFKLIATKPDQQYRYQLFNLTNDPGETKDIAGENKPLIRALLKEILEIRKDNQARLKQNAAKIGKSTNLQKEYQKTLEQLKSLGYL